VTPAKKSPFFNAIFWRYIRRSLRRQFGRILFCPVPLSTDRPTIYVANHHTWWDGFFAFALNEIHLNQELYLMMGAEQFQKFPFFRRLGVFSVDQSQQADVAAAFRYSVRILTKKTSTSLWIFPAGEMLVPGSPVRYRDGFARIARAAGAVQVVPVAFWTGFVKGQYPDVAMLFGSAIDCAEKSSEEIFEQGVAALEHVAGDLRRRMQQNSLEGFRPLLEGRDSVSQRYARFKGVE
jgi:1-acyl-sn-glycerol-3-phosphate acyltransferase